MNDFEKNEEPNAIDLFADFLGREDSSLEVFDALCLEHPSLKADLQRLRNNLVHVEGILAQPAEQVALNARTDRNQESAKSAPSKAVRELKTELTRRFAADSSCSDRYQQQGIVGRGGMGTVLQIWDEHLQRRIAMKVLAGTNQIDVDRSNLTPRRLRRFLEEVQITAQLDHPGVVPVHELGLDDDGRPFFTMRLVRGRDLRAIFELVREGQEDWTRSRALSTVQRVCETMAFAHEHGVVHRDLKPANIMVGNHGETYVMDWGLAKLMTDRGITSKPTPLSDAARHAGSDGTESDSGGSNSLLTSEGTVLGTPNYMPPEQARGELASIGPRSDVYSVGAMLYHLLAGHPPFMGSGESSSASVILEQLLIGPPDNLDHLDGGIPAELTAICERAMSRDPAQRYANMGDMADDLRAYQEGRVVRAYQTGAVAEFRKWVRRNRGMAASLAAGILLALGGLASASIVQARSNTALAFKNQELDTARSTAVTEAERARASEKLARDERQKVLRLADQDRLDELRENASTLYPARPDKLAAMEMWLRTARELTDRLPQYRADLDELQAGAEKHDPKHQLANSPHRENAEFTQNRLTESRELLARKREDVSFDSNGSRIIQTVDSLEKRLANLEQQTRSWRPWIFATRELEWHYNQLLVLTRGIDELNDPNNGLRVRINERYRFAQQVAEQSLFSEKSAAVWAEAIASIQDESECPLYRGLVIEPQIGLLPLARSDVSGLWEFSLIETGELPELKLDGSFEINEETGLVFVLVPGGISKMGSIRPSSEFQIGSPYVDPQSDPDEYPLTTVKLDPFFASKYECTQGQWLRLTGDTPSYYAAGGPDDWEAAIDLTHPVDSVRFDEARYTLALFDMLLPTEAQWEYFARAGTTTTFWTGNQSSGLRQICNLADLEWLRLVEDVPHNPNENWSDGFDGTSPVGFFPPNPFGLHDTMGNVWEMCLDESAEYTRDRWKGTGEIYSGSKYFRVARGGSANNNSRQLRSAERFRFNGEARSIDIGLRPVVSLKAN